MESFHRWSKGAILAWMTVGFATLILAVSVIASSFIGHSASDASSHPSSSTTTTTTAPDHGVDLTNQAKKQLTVKVGDLLPSKAKCNRDEFIANSLSNRNLVWSDSVSTPFRSLDPSRMMTEVRSENCGNPTVLDMNVQALSAIKLGDFSVADANPWIAKFLHESKGGLRTAWLTNKEEQGDKIFVTGEMQQYAALVNTLLLRFHSIGIVTEQSVTNWHLPGGGLVAGELARVVLNDTQEGLPVLRLELTEKARGCIIVIGFNVLDKRWETLPCATIPPPAISVPGQPGTPPSHHHRSCPPGTTGTPPNCLTGKDPAMDPASQGNAPTGGGQNQDPGPGQYIPPGSMIHPPAVSRVNPSPPQVAPPAGSQPDPAPAPAVESNAPPPDDPATGCTPPPGFTTC